MRLQPSGAADDLPDNDDMPFVVPAASQVTATVQHLRRATVWLVVSSTFVAILLALLVGARVDPQGTFVIDWILASLLAVSRLWWHRTGHHRVADACGTFALIALGGMAGGAIAMLELALHFPLVDEMLRSWDLALGLDGLAITDWLLRQGHWVFVLMKPAYNYTILIFFCGVVALSLLGDRVEAWRAAFCFVGALLTTCLIAVFVPAKGLGVWAPAALLDRLPRQAMRTFWPHFDQFYSGADPVLRLQVIDGVVSFPSFHAVTGFLVVAMWRRHVFTLILAVTWLIFMLFATLPGGGHYLVDLLAGFAVWASWFGLSRKLERAAVRATSGPRRI